MEKHFIGWACICWLLEHGERAPVLMKGEPLFGLLAQVRHEVKRIKRKKTDD